MLILGLFSATGKMVSPPAQLSLARQYCELQYKCTLLLEFFIENTETMENCPWKIMVLYCKMADYCCHSRYFGVASAGGKAFFGGGFYNDPVLEQPDAG